MGRADGARGGTRRQQRPQRQAAPPPRNWNRLSLVIVVAAGLLLATGLVMTLSASFVEAARDAGDPFAIARRQALWAAVGLPPAAAVALAGPQRLRPLAWPALLLACALSAVVLVPSIGQEVHGARRWLPLGPIGLQPSELLKVTVPLLGAHLLARRWTRLRDGDVHGLLMPLLPVIAVATLLVLAGPDLETAVLVAAAGGMVLVAAGLPGRLLVVGLGGTTALALTAIALTPFRRLRISAWLDPSAYAGDIGYQSMQGYISLGSGGLTGRGLGQGRGQWLFVPNAHTDFIFAIIGEELGLLGALAVLAAFTALVIAGISAALRAPDAFGRLLAAGLVTWIAGQALINMGSVVGVVPVTGVTLPLVSFGGTSLLITLVAVGMLVGVARSVETADRHRRAEADT